MGNNPGFQVSLDLSGRQCLVIGGDDDATEKVFRLLDAGAKVVVVNPTLSTELRKLTASAKVIHRGRKFRSTDTQGVFLVLNTIQDDKALSQELDNLAKTEKFLLWSMDQPSSSNVLMPALVNRGHLRLAISTSNASPALASALRQQCEEIFDGSFIEYLDHLGTLRDKVQEEDASEKRRREQLKGAVEGFRLVGTLAYPQSWRDEQARMHTSKQEGE
jgi:precorrin-2 dehydrogenase/sirohydrochlorin ferrochelatase